MPHHPLIETYLRHLRETLPADAALELTSGLEDTYDHFRAHGLSTDAAARAALADFGAVADITAAFDQITPGRHAARALLAAGPLFGTCWVAALLTGHARDWPIPVAARIAFAAVLLTVIALLVLTATSSYRHARRAGATAVAATGGMLLVDLTAVSATALFAPAPTWPLLLAITGSLTRIGLTAPALRTLIYH
jgi:hypothetical protein